jgi:rod shape-determining protein MreC
VIAIGAPFLGAASWLAGGIGGTWKSYVDLRAAAGENARLRERLETLTRQANEGEETRQEAARLRALLGVRETAAYGTVTARVIGKESVEGARILLIDRGRADGVRPNQPAITAHGVVGRVIDVSVSASKVQTILDPNSAVAAIVQRTRVQGIVIGAGEAGCRMDYVSDLLPVEVGDVVVTSGLDQIHPKGEILGIVAAVGQGDGLTQVIEVRPEVDFRRIEELLVVLKPEGGAPEPAP